ncbi:MAG: metallophosphoesterase, partial [candidate division Zixibacteria bacterium]|nr:metallophosphoesterase [candidate division Zixibacteria bacterium]
KSKPHKFEIQIGYPDRLLGVGEYNRLGWLSTVTSPLVVFSLVLEICLMFSLPISGIFNLTEKLLERCKRTHHETPEKVADPRRRLLLRGAAVLIPVASVSSGVAGVGYAYGCADVSLKPFQFDNLPTALEGLRILQLSDIHLRHYVTLDDLEEILSEAVTFTPDLILLTGDIADDLTLLPDTLAMIAQTKPRLGAYAILGNHEYFRGVAGVRRAYDASEVPLLVDEEVQLKIGDITLLLGGVDDPRSMHDIAPEYFHNSLSATFGDTLKGDFSILMSHRPNVFDEATRRGVDLTLAGHTHGGQIGFGGRSILDSSFPNSYLWGHYEKNGSHLYTSCGAGHWFPFRLGCPAEAPIIELRTT